MYACTPFCSTIAPRRADFCSLPKHWYGVHTRNSLQLWLANLRAQATESISISPALLGRARSVAAEHGKLTRQLTIEYDTDVAKKVGESSTTVKALEDWESASNVSRISDVFICSRY